MRAWIGVWMAAIACSGKAGDTAIEDTRPPETDTDTPDTEDTETSDPDSPRPQITAEAMDVGGWMEGGADLVTGGVDLNGDGVLDLAISDGDTVRIVHAPPPPGTTAAIADLTTATLTLSGLAGLTASRDLDGDGNAELIGVTSSADGGAWLVSAPVPDGAEMADVAAAHVALPYVGGALDAGDLTGDGVDDLVLVDTNYSDQTLCQDTRALVLAGPIVGDIDALTAVHSGVSAMCGDIGGPEQLASGDVDGDGMADLVAATPGANPIEYVGFVDGPLGGGFVSFGPLPSGATTQPDVVLEGAASHYVGLPRGESVAVAGDVTGDGIDDVLLGGPTDLAVFDVHTRSSYAETDVLYSGEFKTAAGLGTRVAGVGDVDGDGFDDVLVTAAEDDWDGRAYLLYGPLSGDVEPIYDAPVRLVDGAFRFGDGMWVGDLDGDDRGDAVILDPEAPGALWLPGSVWSSL